MFVDPEILDALDEEQKQILFIKIREEQVKRWKAFEEKCEQEGEPHIRKLQDNSRRVRWLKGEDGEVWVWVMGEHKDDLTIEEITERRVLEEARQLAEKETLENMHLTELNNDYIPMVGPNEDENTLKEQLSRMEPWNRANTIQESMYEDANSIFDITFNGNMQWTMHNASSQERIPRKGILKHPNEQLPVEKTRGSDFCSGIIENNTVLVEKRQILPSTSTHSSNLIDSFVSNSNYMDSFGGRTSTDSAHLYSTYSLPRIDVYPELSIRLNHGFGVEGSVKPDSSNLYEQKKPSTLSRKSSAIFVPPLSLMSVNSPSYPGIITRDAQFFATRNLNTDINGEISKRQSEIFEKIKEKHQQFDEEAEQEAQRVEQAWEEQEKKARQAEAQIRRIAQRAREQHRQLSLRTSSLILPVLKDTNALSLKEALRSFPRPPKPKSREAIINWFKIEELQKGTGFDPLTHRPAIWFHGIISRSRADELLQNKPSGSFLVRVSERIWGYTVSYVVGDGNVKHFLIESIPEGYQFLGTNQVVHSHLHELISFHEVSPITVKGNEILRWAVGQVDLLPDYADLFSV